jgi:predicted ABC-type ATPase
MSQRQPAKEPQAKGVQTQSQTPLAHPRDLHRPTPSSNLSHAAIQRAQADPRVLSPDNILQLQRTVGNQAVQRLLRQESQAGFEADSDFERQLSHTKGRGSPLPQKTQQEFEQSFGTNLDKVRIHTNATSNQLNRSIQAKAFTHGNDIHFDAGEFNPTTAQGKHLLAHELTHTIQQTGGKQAKGVQTKLQVGAANDRYEQEAEHIASRVAKSQHVTPQAQAMASPRIQRKGEKEQVSINGQTKSVTKNDKDALKTAITEMSMKGKKSVKPTKRAEAVLLMGASGSGKSSIINEVIDDPSTFVHADPDMVKSAMPAYQAGIKQGNKNIANMVHDESKNITKSIVDSAITTRRNLLYDGTGGNLQEYSRMIANLKKVGYHVKLVMTHISVNEGLKRVAERAAATGRDIPTDVVKDMYKWVPINFPVLVSQVDNAYLFDNMVPKGQLPKLVWEKGDGTTLKPEEIDGLKDLLASIDAKKMGKAASPAKDNKDASDNGGPSRNYLQDGGTRRWMKDVGSGTSKSISEIDVQLRLYRHYRSKRRGNAEEQAQLLFGMQKAIGVSKYQTDISKQKSNFLKRKQAVSGLKVEVDRELRTQPVQLPRTISTGEQVKELTRVGFSEQFLSGLLKIDLRLLYEAHVALSYHRPDLAQAALDRLNPVARDDKGKLKYKGTYLERTRNQLHFAQQMLSAHHHASIGGAYASMFKLEAMQMSDAKTKKINKKYVRNEKFLGKSTIDTVKNPGANYPSTYAPSEIPKKLEDLKLDHPTLSSQELEAIRIYSTGIYRQMNATMHDIRMDNPKKQKGFEGYSTLNQLAMSGLSKLPSYSGSDVVRGDQDASGLGATLRAGTTFLTPSFLSTSKSQPFPGAILWKIKVASHSRGKDIQYLSVSTNEAEVLFPPGTKLKIVEVFRRVLDPFQMDLIDGETPDQRSRRMWKSDSGKRIADDILPLLQKNGMRSQIIIAQEL